MYITSLARIHYKISKFSLQGQMDGMVTTVNRQQHRYSLILTTHKMREEICSFFFQYEENIDFTLAMLANTRNTYRRHSPHWNFNFIASHEILLNR